MKHINYARLAGLLEGTMVSIPGFVNTPGFKITDPVAFKNFMKQLIREAEMKAEDIPTAADLSNRLDQITNGLTKIEQQLV